MKVPRNNSSQHASAMFHPLIREWFQKKYKAATDIQEKAWPVIASGNNLLLTAPTGSGKTLTAFLWALDRLISGVWETGSTSVLYISPLKALNNDIQRNLLSPLGELRELAEKKGVPFPNIRTLTRSGDTPSSERQKMLRHPPEILITTPESLNLILTARKSRNILLSVKSVILDEIHAIAAGKRGTHLITAVERVCRLSGEFQRIAISATIRPLDRIADFVGGYKQTGSGYEKRDVETIESRSSKNLQIAVRFPDYDKIRNGDDSIWEEMCGEFKTIIKSSKSTLIFVNSRRLAEKLTLILNRGEEEIIAYAHHGSLSKELRFLIEKRLKAGELSAIVATSSLEMGIDIGELERVILVQTPFSIASSVQRIGRSGHSVGDTSKGVLFPTHGMDLLNAAVTAKMSTDQDIEEVTPVRSPLDLLSQILISITSVSPWNIDELYAFIRCSYPYRGLAREEFDMVLEMLEGGYEETKIRELKARISIDRISNTVAAKKGAGFLIYSSGGTIPDRGYYSLVLKNSGARIGELDEEFVWERSTGDRFSFGTQKWKITGIDDKKVEVIPWSGSLNINVFWKAEEISKSYHFQKETGDFLELWNDSLDAPEFIRELSSGHFMETGAAEKLRDFLLFQKKLTKTDLPHRHHILIEHSKDNSGGDPFRQVIIHTGWGGKINKPFSYALSAAWEKRNLQMEFFSDNNSILLLLLPEEKNIRSVFNTVTSDNIEELLLAKLEGSNFFGSRFRENAGRALLLPSAGFKKRMPLWFNRLRSRKLLESVSSYKNFPIILETWKTCIEEEFDIKNLKLLLDEVSGGRIKISEIHTPAPSPFTSGLLWKNTDKHMYGDDTPFSGGNPGERKDIIKEMVFSSGIRPALKGADIEKFRKKLQRTLPGYSPGDNTDLIDWVKERLLIPQQEWTELMSAIRRDHENGPTPENTLIRRRLIKIRLKDTAEISVAAIEAIPRILFTLDLTMESCKFSEIDSGAPLSVESAKTLSSQMSAYRKQSRKGENTEAENLVSQWLSYYGPVPVEFPEKILGPSGKIIQNAADSLVRNKIAVRDLFSETKETVELCDAENLERLLYFIKKKAIPDFTPLSSEHLPLFLARIQGLVPDGDLKLTEVLDKMIGYPAKTHCWETGFFPARLPGYKTGDLDKLLMESDLEWFGCGKERVSFRFSSEAELVGPGLNLNKREQNLLPDNAGKYNFREIKKFSGIGTKELADRIWKELWKGSVLCDSWETLRKGFLNGFKLPENPGEESGASRYGRRRTASFKRWHASLPLTGGWYSPEYGDREMDLIEEEEVVKDRIRQLLLRYGILFKELLTGELPPFRWKKIFRSLRIMELSGEILSGCFFEEIPGLQFISRPAFSLLTQGLPKDNFYWLSAADPASLCGTALPLLKTDLPKRLASTRIVYKGTGIMLICRKNFNDMEFRIAPEHPDMNNVLDILRTMFIRDFNPPVKIKVSSINGKPVELSEYSKLLLDLGFEKGYKRYTLWPLYSDSSGSL